MLDQDEERGRSGARSSRRISASRAQVGGARARGRLVEQQHPRPRRERGGKHQQPLLEAVERLGAARRRPCSSPTALQRRRARCRVGRRPRAAPSASPRRPAARRCRARAAQRRRPRSRAPSAVEGRRALQRPDDARRARGPAGPQSSGDRRRGISPSSSASTPPSARSAVVFPEPFAPTSATASPGATSRSKPSSARTPAVRLRQAAGGDGRRRRRGRVTAAAG